MDSPDMSKEEISPSSAVSDDAKIGSRRVVTEVPGGSTRKISREGSNAQIPELAHDEGFVASISDVGSRSYRSE